MANEFTVRLNGSLVNGELVESFGSGIISGSISRNFNQTAAGVHSTVVTVGQAAEEDMPVGDVTTEGFLYLKNLDDTNYVIYGPKSGGVRISFGRIKPGEEHWIRLEPGVVLRWQANVADVKVQMKLFQD